MWKKLKSSEIYLNKWMTVTEELVETNSGKQLTFGMIRKTPGVMIVPWDGKNLTIVGQYRYPMEGYSWEFPSGGVAEGETLEEAAKRELKEETGLKSETLRKIGVLYISNGNSDETCHIFLATGLKKGIPKRDYSEEEMQVKEVAMKEFQKMIDEKLVQDSPTISSMYFLLAKNIINESI